MTHPESPHADRPARAARRRFGLRFSLRTLLIAMTAVSIFCGWWMNQAIRQRTAVRRFYQLTAARPPSGHDHLTTMGYRYRGKDAYYKPIIPKWLHPLRDVVGEEAFGEVTGVQLTDTAATNEDLLYLARFPTLERVWLSGTNVTDEGILSLHACPKLRMLTLAGLPITDEGVAQISVLTDLESLSLNGTRITDAGLEHLAQLPKMKELWLRNTAITNDGYLKLQAALPNCHIQADVPAYFQKYQLHLWSGSPSRN